jgi:hypothetical protein
VRLTYLSTDGAFTNAAIKGRGIEFRRWKVFGSLAKQCPDFWKKNDDSSNKCAD